MNDINIGPELGNFTCVDQSYFILGNYESSVSSQFVIALEMEKYSNTSNEEVLDYEKLLNNLYYLELIITEELFYQDKYKDKRIQKVARSVSFPINEH